MRPFLALLELSFKSLLLTTMNVGSRGKKRNPRSGVGAFILLSALMLYLSGTYSFLLASALSAQGALDLMLVMMMLMALAWPFIFIMFASQSLVYNTKDIDLVLSLPVSSFAVMLSRVMALYLEALLMCEMMLIPAGVAYLAHGGAGGVGFMALLLVQGVFLALIPTVLALVFGALVSLVVARLPFKSLFTVLFSLLFVVGIMVFSFSFSFSFSGGEAIDIAGLRETVAPAFPPVYWAVQALMGRYLYIIPVLLVCVVPFLAVTWLFSKFYKRLLTSLSSHRLKSDYKLGAVGASGSSATLFKKEARKFFGTPAFLLNSGIGVFLLIIASVVALFNRGAITAFFADLTGMGAGEVLGYLPPLMMAVILFFGSMTYISSVSISLEGKTLWILKEAPLSVTKIFAAKAGFSFLIGALAAVVCVPLLGVAFSLPVVDVLLMVLIGLLFPLFTSVSGLFINLLMPRMDAENDTLVIKQSASVMVSMLLNMLVLAGLVVGYIFLRDLGFVVCALLAAAVLAVLGGLALVLLNTKGRKLYAEL